jgi:DNA excision repair protein ERCC-4
MLNKTVPVELITGIVVLHAEEVTPTSSVAFIARIYRRINKDGFLKAFSDDADSFAMGLSPLQTVMGQLQIRKVELWPRFHRSIIRDLGERKADVVELHQPLSRSMKRIQDSIVECLDATLNEVKRSVSGVEVDEYTLENAIFRAFDVIVQRQLQPRMHQLSSKMKRLVKDLQQLRFLLGHLISYDAVNFLEMLDLIQARQSKQLSGFNQDNRSPWLDTDAANVIYREARARVYIGDVMSQEEEDREKQSRAAKTTDDPIEIDSDEEEAAFGGRSTHKKSAGGRAYWLPPGIEPTLEEQPKWQLLREVLDEVEQEIYFSEDKETSVAPNNTILIMTATDRTRAQLQSYLSSMNDSIIGEPDQAEGDEAEASAAPAKRMMMRFFREYLKHKGALGQMAHTWDTPLGGSSETSGTNRLASAAASTTSSPDKDGAQSFESDALKRKQIWERGAAPPNKRRRQRGAAVSGTGSSRSTATAAERFEKEAMELSEFQKRAQALVVDDDDDDDLGLDDRNSDDEDGFEITGVKEIPDQLSSAEFDNFFGILTLDDLVVVRTYRGDSDDYVLQELRPRFIVMYDPDPAFVRRIEMYRSTTAGVNPRVYFLLYAESIEEQRYLSSIRREKESFEKLIRERSIMALPLQADGRPAVESADDRFLRTINSRIAGGQRGVTQEPPRIIVDMREFNSSLASMLDLAGIIVIPRTLTIGDYVLSPEMCVERKSVLDLIQSLNNGRLYSQCEGMTLHYLHPILLIEFDQDKSFSLQSVQSAKSGPKSKQQLVASKMDPNELDTQTKLVMLAIAFPRLKIVWSPSSSATADIFAELKSTYEEPDADKAAGLGVDSETVGTYNTTPQDILLMMPGITTKNYRYVQNNVRDLEELCDLELAEIQELIGIEAGRKLHSFIVENVRIGLPEPSRWRGNWRRRIMRSERFGGSRS